MSSRLLVMPSVVIMLCNPMSNAQQPAAKDAPAGAPGLVRQIKVLPDKAPDCSSLKSIVETVTRGCKTNDDKAVAIYNFMMLTHYHRAYPSEPGGIPVLKEINTYGWSLCGGLHSEQSALWRELGWEWRFVGWNGHTTVEARYDGRWHYLDVFLKFYAWMPDPNAPNGRTIAGEDDLNNNSQALILDAFVLDKARNVVYAKDNRFEVIGEKANWTAPAFLVCGDTIQGVIDGLKTHRAGGADQGWAGIHHATGSYSADVSLAPGQSLTNTWDSLGDDAWYWAGEKIAPQHTCGSNKDLRNSPEYGLVLEPYFKHQRSYCNGTLMFAPDFSNDAFLKSLSSMDNARYEGGALVPATAGRPASVTVPLQSPYIMTKATGAGEGADSLEISVDGGKTFKAADLKDFTDAVKGHVSAQARIHFKTTLKSLKLEVIVQNNSGSLPFLSPGKNVVAVSAADPAALGDNKLVVTCAYAPGFRSKSFEQLCEEDKEVARQHNATWADAPTVVQKVFAAGDLPATFEIDVPTPKGKYPVYPRMLFLRREVIAAKSKPLPLPAGAVEMKVGTDEELKTLPDPFLMGSQPPPARPVRPTKTIQVPLAAGHAVSLDGQTARNHFIKWKEGETWVLLVGGQLQGLPDARDIAEARLVLPVVRGHKDAAAKVGAVMLKAPFEPDKPYDFKNLSEPVGTMNVPKQPEGKDYDPPKEFRMDLTRTLKAVARGEAKFHGLAIRTVPDRSVDDGWIVRIDVPDSPRIYLEIDIYTGPASLPAGAP